MEERSKFYTLKGYELYQNRDITSAMEDYLEMIVRLSEKGEEVRITQLADKLNVKPSSASKMADNLKRQELICFEKYGYIRLTESGRALGGYLILRHDVVSRLLCLINQTDDDLEEVEKIEHFLSPKTIGNMVRFLEQYPDSDR